MIIPVSVRDTHPQDVKIIAWYNSLSKSDKSREIRRIILAYLDNNRIQGEVIERPAQQVVMAVDAGNALKKAPVIKELDLANVSIARVQEVDLEAQLDNIAI